MITLESLVARFKSQLERAGKAGIHEPTACAVASVGADGRPSVRMVLLKHADERGFVFCTNLESRKGREILANRSASLLFWWGPLAEQVRVEGRTEVISAAEADAHFNARPRGSRIGAWASNQSRPIASREELLERVRRYEAEYPGEDVPRPAHWSGFRVVPDCIEFWYGQESRLHERVEYRREPDGSWSERILAP